MCNNFEKILKNFTAIILITNIVAEGGLLNFDRLIKFNENEYCKNSTYSKRFAIIIHGWKESCSTPWTIKLTENLKKYRGGCIMCMDYNIIASIPYYLLAIHTTDIATVLTKKLQKLENSKYDPNQGYIFGFSLGGRIAIQAGRMFGKQKLAEIDTCDMAGPGFDIHLKNNFKPKDSAKNVQCIHTSNDKGTKERNNCHQNWIMGYCGNYQLAATKMNSKYGSHGLCTEFYNSAFENNFYAEINPKQCDNHVKNNYENLPKYYKMGYMENRKYIYGEFYASTTENYPYTNNDDNNNSSVMIRFNNMSSSSSSMQSQSIYKNYYNNHDEINNNKKFEYRVFVIVRNKIKYFRKSKLLFKENIRNKLSHIIS